MSLVAFAPNAKRFVPIGASERSIEDVLAGRVLHRGPYKSDLPDQGPVPFAFDAKVTGLNLDLLCAPSARCEVFRDGGTFFT